MKTCQKMVLSGKLNLLGGRMPVDHDELMGMYEAFAGRMELYTKLTDAIAAPELPADDLKAKLKGYIASAT
jgi:hypothetical protein